jgi:competence protein ComEC
MDAFLVLGLALVASSLVAVNPWPFLAAVAGCLGVLRLEGALPRRLLACAAVAVVLGGVRADRALEEHEVRRAAAWSALPAPSRCTAQARVAVSPVRTHGLLRWDGDLSHVSCEERDLTAAGVVRAGLYGGPSDLARGDRLLVTLQIATVERFWNPATGDPRPNDARRGTLWSGSVLAATPTTQSRSPLAWIDRARARVRERIAATFPDDTGAMARALVLGESDLSDADDADFRASGLAHLLAVSGMHLVLVVAGATKLLRAVLVRVPRLPATHDVMRLTSALALPLVWIYAELAGAGGSTLRAAWMMSVSLLARALGGRSTAPRAFGLSLVAMAVVDPLTLFDLSFLLSGGATAGLIALSTPIGSQLSLVTSRAPERLQGPLGWIATAVAPTLAATLPCAPILARFAPTQPLGGVVANLVAVPLGETVALPLCLLHAVASPLPPVESGAAMVATGALRLVRAIAHFFAHFKPLLVPVPPPNGWQLALAAVGFVVVLGTSGRRGWLLAMVAAGMLASEGLRIRAGGPRGVLRATFLDVGQGDSALVDLPSGEGMLIDGGGIVGSPVDTGTRVVAPMLRDRRRSSLAAVVLSHPHPDHFTGLVSGLDGVDVGALWDSGQGEREGTGGGYAALLASMRRRGVPIKRPDELCGRHLLGGATVDVLAPCPGPSPDQGPNDNSLVVRIQYGRRALLFVGDSERTREAELVALGQDRLRADVLKVGHHGSRTSTTEPFLAAVSPAFAVISTGLRNRFGHPHPTTLATLARRHVKTFRTDADGAVTAWTDGERLVLGAESGRTP